jgi:hypothetical protein
MFDDVDDLRDDDGTAGLVMMFSSMYNAPLRPPSHAMSVCSAGFRDALTLGANHVDDGFLLWNLN